LGWNLITVMCIIGILMFAIQLIFCVAAKRITIKFIPVYIILFAAILAAALYLGVFGSGSFNASQILAWLLAMVTGAAIVGDVLAWVVYVDVIKRRAKENK